MFAWLWIDYQNTEDRGLSSCKQSPQNANKIHKSFK